MRRSGVLGIVAILALLTLRASSSAAAESHSKGGHCTTSDCDQCVPAEPKMVECTVLVPEMSLETRTVMVPEYRLEQRQRKIVVPHYIPRQVNVERPYTVLHPKVVTKTVQCMVRRPVYANVEERYTVGVPHVETRSGTRKVCKLVATEKKRTVTVDQGHWEDAPAAACQSSADCASPVDCCRPRCRLFRRCSTGCAIATCGGDNCCGRVWVSNPVQQEVTYTCHEQVWVDEPYTCQVTVLKPEVRTRNVCRCTWVFEPHTKQVTQTIFETERRTKTCNLTRYDYAPEEKMVTCTVCVPHYVPKQIQVQVCKLVPKTVQVPAAPVCAPPACCENGCCTGRARRCRGC